MNNAPPAPRSRHCLLGRVDYGHEPLVVPRGWAEADLSRQPLDEALRIPKDAAGLCLRRAEWALAWAGTREGARQGSSLFARLARISARRGLVLECRFPRHARELASRLEAAQCETDRWETEADGSIPPLYVDLSESLKRWHAAYEWETAVGAARGGAALLRVALVLAREGPQPAPHLAGLLGLTAGATRAYLSWMEDVALVRRHGRAFDFRHPVLRELFAAAPARGLETRPIQPAAHRPSAVDWD